MGDNNTSLLDLICNNGGYRKENKKHTRNKLVLAYMVYFVCWKDIELKKGGNTDLGIWTL